MMANTKKIDINVATIEELEALTGVGRAKAEAIVGTRNSLGGFTSVEDLTQVPGIGSSLIELNKHVLTVCLPGRSDCSRRQSCRRRGSTTSTPKNDGSSSLSAIAENQPHSKSHMKAPSSMSCSSCDLLVGSSSNNNSGNSTDSVAVATCSLNRGDNCSLCEGEYINKDDQVTSTGDVGSDESMEHEGSEPPGEEVGSDVSLDELGNDSSVEENCRDPPMREVGNVLAMKKSDKQTGTKELEACKLETKEKETLRTGLNNIGTKNIGSDDMGSSNDGTSEKGIGSIGKGNNSANSACVSDTVMNTVSENQNSSEIENTARRKTEECERLSNTCDNETEITEQCNVIPPGDMRDRDKITAEESCWGPEDDDMGDGGNQEEEEDDFEEDDELADSLRNESLFGSKSLVKRKSSSESEIQGTLPCKKHRLEKMDRDLPGFGKHGTDFSRATYQRKLIPSKDNPPPEMVEWISTFQRWSHAERLLAIDQLIESCEPTQVRHMMQVIEPQFQRDFISLLPKELALYVLSFLEPKDLLHAAQTCRYWRMLVEDNLLWREKCREMGIDDVRETLSRRRHRGVDFVASPWKAAYMRQHNIEVNWRVSPIRPPKVLKGHDDHVITCLQFSGNRIVSGSDDNTLKVWSATTGKCLRTLVGHTGGVWSSQMATNIIISGSTDRTLKVWNAETGHCVHTLYGHTSTVRCMHLHENKVVSGSRDATLRLWDIETGECLHVLVGHVAAVRCVQYDGRLVVSGAYDYMVKVWNPDREECLHTLQGHTNRVYSLQFDGVHVVSGSLDTSIRVWDVETGACKHTLMGHQSLTSGMELRNNILVSGNADSTVKVWDIITGQCLQTLSGPNKHQSAVTCLQFNSKFVITSSDDGTVKLWDVKTGEFVRNLVALESGGSGGVVWRIRANQTNLVCAVGSRNGTEETKLVVLNFDAECK